MAQAVKKSFIRNIIEIVGILALIFVLRTYVFGLYHVPTGSAETNLLVGDRVLGNKLIYRAFRNPKRGDFVMFDEPTFKYDKSNRFKYYWQKYIGFEFGPFGSQGPINVVKRIIALPGDKIEGRIEDGVPTVYLNDQKLDEKYVNKLPLIRLNKKVGLIGFNSLGLVDTPSWLKKRRVPVVYSYDPSKPYDNQPHYNIEEDEVVYDEFAPQPMMLKAQTPTRDSFGRNVDVFGPFVLPKGKYWVMGDSRKNSADSRFWGFLDESLIQGKASLIIYSVDSEEPLWFFELFKNPVKFFTKLFRWKRTFNLI